MSLSIEWLSEFIDAFIDGDAKEETEEYDCKETTWGVFKAYASVTCRLLSLFIFYTDGRTESDAYEPIMH